MKDKLKEKTKERIDKILKVYGGWVHLGNISQSKQVALEQLLSLIDEEKGEREFVLYCPKCRSTMEKIKMVTNSQEKE